MTSYLDSMALATQLRAKIVDISQRRVLVHQFGTLQQAQDITSGINCRGIGRLHRYSRPSSCWKDVPIPSEPAAAHLGLDLQQVQIGQLFQLAACDYRCWYCFVDRKALIGSCTNSQWVTANDLIQLYIEDGLPARIICLTGGQPDLVPEWTVWMMRSLEKYHLVDQVYLWQDDNLNCGYTWRYLVPENLEYIKAYPNYGRCCCLKSFSPISFAETTGAAPQGFNRQIQHLRRLVEWGVDVYVYLTLTTSSTRNLVRTMHYFMNRLRREVHPNIPLRIVPLEIFPFTPARHRLTPLRQLMLDNQYVALDAWEQELAKQFSLAQREVPISQVSLEGGS